MPPPMLVDGPFRDRGTAAGTRPRSFTTRAAYPRQKRRAVCGQLIDRRTKLIRLIQSWGSCGNCSRSYRLLGFSPLPVLTVLPQGVRSGMIGEKKPG